MGNDALARVSHTHDMVMNWMLQNPDRPLAECAEHFGYTQPWLSTLVHSDIFQARFKQKQEACFRAVAEDVPRKLSGLASQVIDKVSADLEKSNDRQYHLDAFDSILHKAGYAPKTQVGAVQNNNTFNIAPDVLANARAQMKPKEEAQVIEGQIVENESKQIAPTSAE